ncbi:uncharacterized protein [Chelonus insularis]|uniref:uncharacterized protein n=1 Tax=Chelonus insularis TaxID=460826 RepID=UPI00158D11D6|nr:uncharacterized protein LOC118070806 [Chelonus insularis]
MELRGRVALVTGASSGIGRTFVEELLNQGAKVSICDINAEEGEKLTNLLTSKHGKDRVIFCQCDVTDYPQFEESFKTTIATFGNIDIVINNAGIMNDRFWELEVDINLNGVIRGTLLAQRYLGIDRGGRGGIVINTGSNVSLNPYVSVPIYSATKAAIVSLTRAFGDKYHVDLTGVSVMALCPNATDSNLVRDVGKQLLSPRYEDAWRRDTASSVPQKAEHVAKALIHVLSTGKSGSVWLVENGQPVREIAFAVAILDLDPSTGAEAAKKLNEEFGKNQSIFIRTYMSKANHFEGTIFAIKTMGKHKDGKGGTVINVGSSASLISYRTLPVYCGTKSAVFGFTRAIALSYDQTGVAMKTVCPGPVGTSLLLSSGDKFLSFHSQEKDLTVQLPNPQTPESIAEQIVRVIEETPNGTIYLTSMGLVIKDSLVIITGGAQGIGFQLCHQLLSKKAKTVAILDIDVATGEEAVKKLNNEFGKDRSFFIVTDVTNTQQFEENFKKAVNQLGGLNIMINNAGFMDDSRWKKEIDLNVTGVVQGTLLAIETMGKHKGGAGGTVINMASIAAFLYEKYVPVYCATKAAVIEFTRCVSLNYEKTGVAIKAMCPGATETFLMTNKNPRYLNFHDQQECINWVINWPKQTPDVLVKEVIHMIEEAPNGAVWVKMANHPVSTVNFPKLTDIMEPL